MCHFWHVNLCDKNHFFDKFVHKTFTQFILHTIYKKYAKKFKKVLKIIFFLNLYGFEFWIQSFFTIDYWNCRIFLLIGKELWCLFCYCKIALFKILAAYKILPIRIIWNIILKIYIAKIWMPKNSDGSKIPKFSLGLN